MSEGLSDQELIDACATGDVQAFTVLYRRHRDALLRMALRLGRDEHVALDAVQDAFVYLLGKVREPGFALREGVRLTTLLYPVLRSAVVDHARTRLRFVGDADLLLAKLVDEAAPASASGEDDVRRVLDALPGAQRETVELHVLEGLTLAEVAEATGVPVGTAKTRLHHALRKLRDDPATRRYFEA